MRIRLYQQTEDNLFYFQFLTKEDQLILDSQGYQTKDARNTGVNSVKTNASIVDRYENHKEGNQHYFTLKAANHQEIARSPMFASEEEMGEALNTLYVKAGGKGEPPAKVGTGKEYVGKKGDDNYRPLAVYEKNTKSVVNGFGTFAEDDDHFFFAFNLGGKTILLSEAYTTLKGRDNGVNSVTKNMVIEKHYGKKVHSNGKHYFNLIAGNHQEIATSRWFDSEAEMNAAITLLVADGSDASMVPLKAKNEMTEKQTSKEAQVDDYLPCGDYAGGEWFYTFFREDRNEHYFAFNSPNGKTYLRSEGYTTEKARDNGIESVKTNAPIEKRWTTGTALNGKYHYYALKAGNHQEIARSCYYSSEAEMQTAFAWVRGEQSILGEGAKMVDGKWWTAYMFRMKIEEEAAAKKKQEELRLAAVAKEAEAAKLKAEAETARLKAEAEKKAAAAAATALALKKKEEEELKLAAAKKAEAEKDKEDDYLPCKAYKGHAVNDKVNNVAFFKHDNGQFYFVLYDANGDVKLRSEGFRSSKERDQELSGVVRLHNEAKFYSKKELGNHYMDILKDESGQEVGRSCLKKVVTAAEIAAKKEEEAKAAALVLKLEEEKKAAALALKVEEEKKAAALALKVEEEKKAVAAKAAAAAAAALALKKKEEEKIAAEKKEQELKLAAAKKAEAEKDKEDDYLPCKEYKGHAVNDKINNVAFFKHSNGQFYFVLYDANGDVKLRSEGFRTSQERDKELSGVVRLHNESKFYSKKELGNHYMHILKDESGQEVGRSCLKKVVVAPKAPEKKVVVEKKAAATVAAASAAAALFWRKDVKDHEFMHCNEYKGHQVNDKQNKVAFFKKKGKFYFAVYDNGGNVRLRSEAFDSVENRDIVLKAALKNINNNERYFKRDKNNYNWKALKDDSGRVLAWTCAEKKKAAVVAPAAATVAAAATTVATKTVVKEEKKGGFPWWLWLLPFLLLGLLWWQGCFGCNTKVDTPVVPEVTHEEPVVQEPAVIEKSAEELASEKAATEAEEKRIIEERAVREREAAEQVVPAVGVEAGFERVNENK